MESPCLSILVPLLVKGLREKAPVVRKTAVIIDNMVKVRLKLSPWTSPSADELCDACTVCSTGSVRWHLHPCSTQIFTMLDGARAFLYSIIFASGGVRAGRRRGVPAAPAAGAGRRLAEYR